MLRGAVLACMLCILPGLALAEGRQTLGWGRLFSNDAIGDRQDRWQSGSYTLSLLRGPVWTGALPAVAGAVLEYRISVATLTPANLERPAQGDRPYAAPLTLGLHTHFNWQGFETSLGADLVALGPQTGVGRFQSWLHGVLGMPKPDLEDQLGNALYPTLRGEMGRSIVVTDQTTLRPFVAAQAGPEDFLRAGGDLIVGSFGTGALMLRDDASGQRYRAVAGARSQAISLTLGGDVAHVLASDLLQDGGATQTRGRLRAGIAWQGEHASAFYGLTYLTPEFDTQPEGQVIGALNLNFRF